MHTLPAPIMHLLSSHHCFLSTPCVSQVVMSMFFKNSWNFGVQCSKLPYQRPIWTCHFDITLSTPCENKCMCQCSSRIAGTLGCNAPNYLMFFKDRWNFGVQCSKLPYQRSLWTCYLHVSSSCPPLVYKKWSCQCSSRIAGILGCNAPNYPTSAHYALVIFTLRLLVDSLCIKSGHVNVLQA